MAREFIQIGDEDLIRRAKAVPFEETETVAKTLRKKAKRAKKSAEGLGARKSSRKSKTAKRRH